MQIWRQVNPVYTKLSAVKHQLHFCSAQATDRAARRGSSFRSPTQGYRLLIEPQLPLEDLNGFFSNVVFTGKDLGRTNDIFASRLQGLLDCWKASLI